MRTNVLCLPLVLSLLTAIPATALAQATPSAAVKKLRIAVPTALGSATHGTVKLTRTLRTTLADGVAEVIPDAAFEAAQKKLGVRSISLESKAEAAKIGKELGADYVLLVGVSKKRNVHTAHAVLVNSQTAEVQMDFRSEYINVATDAEDRGIRIANKTIGKLEILLKPLTTGTSTAVAQHTGDTGTTGTGDTGTGSSDSGSTDSGFNDPAFAEGGGGEFDGFTTEGGFEWSIRGWVGVRAQTFLHPDLDASKKRYFLTLGTRSTLNGKLGSSARLRVLPLIEVDAVNNRLHRVVLEEGFFELGIDWFELRVGWDALTWGAASTLNIVDVINARDIHEGLIDAPKIGQPMIATKFLFGNHYLQLLFLTPFVASGFPAADSAFSFTAQAPAAGAPVLGSRVVYGSSFEEWYPQAAARLVLAFDGLDLRASVFHGYARFPLVHAPTQTLFFPPITNVSADGQILWGKTTFKFEVASTWTHDTERSRNPPFKRDDGEPAAPIVLPGQRFSWVVGVEQTIEQFMGDTILIPVVEFIGDSDSELFTDKRPPDDALRFSQNALVFGLDWSFENSVGSRLRLADMMDVANPTDHAMELKYSQRMFTHFTVSGGARWVIAADGDKLAQLKQLSGLFLEYRLNY